MNLPDPYYIKEIGSVVVIIITGVILAKLFEFISKIFIEDKDFIKALKNVGITKTYLDFISNLIKYIIYLVFGLLALAQIGFATLMFRLIALLIALISVLVIFLSFKEFIKNAAAGIFLSKADPFEEGDKIKFNGIEGKVIKFTLLTTTVKTKDGTIVIPNSLLAGKKIMKLE